MLLSLPHKLGTSCYDVLMTRKDFGLLRYSGIVGVIVLWTGIVIAMTRAHLGLIDSRPISYLGVNASTAALFSGSLLLSSFLFICFAYYVKHSFHIRNRFMVYFLVGQVGQIIAAVVPYGSHSRYRAVHTVAAFTLAFSLPLLIRQFALSQSKSKHAQTYIKLLRFEQLSFIVGIGLFIFTKGIAPLGEALPTIGFHVWIIAVSILSIGLEE